MTDFWEFIINVIVRLNNVGFLFWVCQHRDKPCPEDQLETCSFFATYVLFVCHIQPTRLHLCVNKIVYNDGGEWNVHFMLERVAARKRMPCRNEIRKYTMVSFFPTAIFHLVIINNKYVATLVENYLQNNFFSWVPLCSFVCKFFLHEHFLFCRLCPGCKNGTNFDEYMNKYWAL